MHLNFATICSRSTLSRYRFATTILLIIVTFSPTSKTDELPLAGFADYIGGVWKQGDIHQTFTWGPGRSSVFAEAYVLQDGSKTVVSKGFWYIDPSTEHIQGVFVAEGMPFEVLHYESEFKAGVLFSQMDSIDANGNTLGYEEQIQLISPFSYQWQLSADGSSTQMTGTFERIRPPE